MTDQMKFEPIAPNKLIRAIMMFCHVPTHRYYVLLIAFSELVAFTRKVILVWPTLVTYIAPL